MRITEIVVKRPVSALVVILAIILFGITSILGMPQELTPEMNMPMLVVYTVYPSAGPEDVEKLVSQEVEGAISSLSGIDTVYSYSMDSVSMVMMQYEYGTDMDVAYTDVKERIDSITNTLPSTAQRPVVIEMDMNAMETMTLSVRSSNTENLLGLVEDEVAPEFQKLSTVADVNVSGGREEYVRVQLMEDKLKQYGITMNSVVNSLSSADFSIPSGEADYGSQSLGVRSSVEYRTAQALENLPISLSGGGVIRLGDVAEVSMSHKTATSVSRYNGEENISIGLQKRQSASAVSMSRQAREVIDLLNEDNAEYHIDIVNDNSETIQDSIMTVAETLVLSIFLSMLVLFVFLGDIRASLIVGSSMPISLLVAFILMSQMGFTINIVTMSSMVLGVGMMVDNSIVVMDSCFKSKSRQRDFVEAALEGSKFVLGSIIGSTITTVVVFFPLAVMEGLSGQMFMPLGFTIIFALVASLFSAMTLVPLFFVQFQPVEKRRAPAARLLKKVELAYGRLLKRLLRRKKTVFAGTVGLIGASLLIFTQLNMELMPAIDQGIVTISLSTRPGLQLESIDEMALQLETMVGQHPDVDTYSMTVGGSGMTAMLGGGSSASITAYLKEDRDMDTNEVVDQWREQTKDMVNGEVDVSALSMTDQISTANISVNLQGNDLDTLKAFAAEVEAMMDQQPGMISVSSTVESPSPQAEIVVDPMRAAAVGYTPMQVAQNINMALSGVETVSMKNDGQEYAIWVEYPPDRYTDVTDLENMVLVTPYGSSVALMDIADIQFTDTPQMITREDGQYLVTLTGVPEDEQRFAVDEAVTQALEAMVFPKGAELADSSMEEMMMDEFTALGQAILIATWLVFMVMTIQFESIRHSLMVMLCIPFSMIGSFALMILSGVTISMVSLLGFLILIGTVVNNGILFVDTANHYRTSMPLTTALVYTGRMRLRPILMTTLTTVLSMLPMAFATGSAEMMRGLALVVIGGMTVSTVLTLLFLPTFYLIIDGDIQKRQARKAKREERKQQRLLAAEAKHIST